MDEVRVVVEAYKVTLEGCEQAAWLSEVNGEWTLTAGDRLARRYPSVFRTGFGSKETAVVAAGEVLRAYRRIDELNAEIQAVTESLTAEPVPAGDPMTVHRG